MAGSCSTLCKPEVKIKWNQILRLIFLHHSTQLAKKVIINVIFGRDLQWEIGINLDFQNKYVRCKETKMPMKSIHCKIRINSILQFEKVKV